MDSNNCATAKFQIGPKAPNFDSSLFMWFFNHPFSRNSTEVEARPILYGGVEWGDKGVSEGGRGKGKEEERKYSH